MPHRRNELLFSTTEIAAPNNLNNKQALRPISSGPISKVRLASGFSRLD
jgi:hypothetical protein